MCCEPAIVFAARAIEFSLTDEWRHDAIDIVVEEHASVGDHSIAKWSGCDADFTQVEMLRIEYALCLYSIAV